MDIALVILLPDSSSYSTLREKTSSGEGTCILTENILINKSLRTLCRVFHVSNRESCFPGCLPGTTANDSTPLGSDPTVSV